MAQIAVAAVMLVAGVYKGMQAKKLKEEEALGYQDAARRRMAAATREMREEERLKENMHSRAVLVAAASGAGVDNPGMVSILGDLNAEGEYRILSRLWAGQNDAEGLQYRADAAKREGKAALTAGIIDGITSAVGAYAGLGGGGTTPTAISTGPTGSALTKSSLSSVLVQPGGLEIPGYSQLPGVAGA